MICIHCHYMFCILCHNTQSSPPVPSPICPHLIYILNVITHYMVSDASLTDLHPALLSNPAYNQCFWLVTQFASSSVVTTSAYLLLLPKWDCYLICTYYVMTRSVSHDTFESPALLLNIHYCFPIHISCTMTRTVFDEFPVSLPDLHLYRSD